MRRSNSLQGSRMSRETDPWTSSQKSDRSASRLSYSSDSHVSTRMFLGVFVESIMF